MALSSPVSIGTAVSKASATLNVTLSGVPEVNGLVVLVVSQTDQTGFVVSDTKSNTWFQYSGFNGPPNLNIYYTRNTGTAPLTNGDTVSADMSGSGNSLMTAEVFYIPGASNKMNLSGSTALTGSGTTPSVSTSVSINTGTNYVALGFILTQGPSTDAFTPPNDWSNIRIGTTGAGANSNVTYARGARVSNTSTGFTYAPTLGTSRTYNTVMVIFQEEQSNTLYWVGGTGSWSLASNANWASSSGGTGGAGIPTGSTDVVFNNASDAGLAFSVALDGPVFSSNQDVIEQLKVNSLTIQNLDNTLSFSGSSDRDIILFKNLNIQTNTSSFINAVSLGNIYYKFYVDQSTTSTIDTNDYDFNKLTYINKFNSGTLRLSSNLNNIQILNIDNGEFDANNFNIKLNSLSINNNTFNRSLRMGSGVWELTGSGSIWSIDPTNLFPETSTILLSNTTTNVTFSPNGRSYYNIVIGGGNNTSNVSFPSTSGQFNKISHTRSVGFDVGFQLNSVYTFTNFLLSGSPGNVIRVGQVGGDPATVTLSKLKPWYVGANSTGTTSTGLIYTAGGGIDYLNFVRVNATYTNVLSSGQMFTMFF